jgi:hypothetical protein
MYRRGQMNLGTLENHFLDHAPPDTYAQRTAQRVGDVGWREYLDATADDAERSLAR